MPSEHLVCLTFDFDTFSGFLAAGRTSPTPISRGEFGVVGAARILALLDRCGVPATWFIPGITLEAYPEACAAIARSGHEVGHHGYEHVPPAQLERAEEAEQLERGNRLIEDLTGRKALGYRSPAWDLSPHTVELLIAQGFRYDSSMMGHDYLPYRARRGDRIARGEPVRFGAQTELLELPVSWSLDDYPHFEFGGHGGLAPATGVLENWLDDYRYMARTVDWGVITYTCHPMVIGRGHRMLMLERLIEMLDSEGATFVTAEQALSAFEARGGAGIRPARRTT